MVLDRSVKVLVVGGGGREHALCWKLAQSPCAEKVFCAPGNGGTAGSEKVENVDIGVDEFDKLSDFCLANKVDLVVVGPDNPLACGIVDFLEEKGLRVFGPRRESARLEWSKAYAKEFMSRHAIPTARFAVCDSLEAGEEIAREMAWARVVKVDGLALGKGVSVCSTERETIEALTRVFRDRQFGAAGDKVVLEERLYGEELSLICLCDGQRLAALLPCQDHKRRFDEDEGPNTGGMGAYAPVDLYRQCAAEIETKILDPLRQALESGDLVYKGALYIGLMITSDPLSPGQTAGGRGPFRPYVLEFNARFGDPETQALLPLMKSDLLAVLWACTEGALDEVKLEWSPGASCCVVACASRYPEGKSSGEPLEIASLPPDTFLFHAGTVRRDGALLTNGGRVLAVTATGATLDDARQKAYSAMKSVQFPGIDYRRDIGKRAIAACQSG